MLPLTGGRSLVLRHSGALILAIFLLFGLLGCAQTQKWTIEASNANLAQAKVSREAIQGFMSTWALNSGVVQCGAAEWLTVSVMTDLQKMDALVKESGLWDQSDFNRGCFAGVGTKLASKEIYALVQWAISMAASAK